MSCDFCKEIVDFNEAEKSMKHGECAIIKDFVDSIGLGMYFDRSLYYLPIKYCPECGRKLVEE